MNHVLQKYIDIIPNLRDFINVDQYMLFITDLHQVVTYWTTYEHVEMKIGDQIMDGSPVLEAMRDRKEVYGEYPASLFGFAFKSIARPIMDGDECVGSICLSYSLSDGMSTGSRNTEEKVLTKVICNILKIGTVKLYYNKNKEISDVDYSERFRKMLGFETQEDFPNEMDSWVCRIHPNDIKFVKRDIQYATEHPNEFLELDYRIMTKNGEYRWFHSAGEATTDLNGKLSTFGGVLIDITDKKKAEEIKKAEEAQNKVLLSIADIYLTMHLIDLDTYAYEEYKSNDIIRSMPGMGPNALEISKDLIEKLAEPEFVDRLKVFADLSTLRERIGNEKVITTEYRDLYSGWIRAQFIVVERDEADVVRKVLLTTQIIETEKEYEAHLIAISTTDALTGCLNRRAYEDAKSQYMEKGIDNNFVFFAIDINNLKHTNDTLGHEVGDRMIVGAANVIREVIGVYGNVYRNGGDEFAAIIHAHSDELDSIRTRFEERICTYGEENNINLSLSYGYASKAQYPKASFYDLLKLADQKMYDAKTLYYKLNGIDRRANSSAAALMFDSYLKVLEIDLTHDAFKIISLNEEKEECPCCISTKISEWFAKYLNEKRIFDDDVAEYAAVTKLDYLQNYFENNETPLSFRYRRKVNNIFKSVMMELIRSNEYTNDNQLVYLYIKEI